MLENCGKPNAKVDVLTNPRAQGYENAKNLLLEQIIDRYAHFDLLLFLPDADGRDRKEEFKRLESEATNRGVHLFCCAAEQEVEVWLLAGHAGKLSRPWQQVRTEISVKETVFTPFLQRFGDDRSAGGGRKQLMNETLKNYAGLLQRCPELANLEQRILKLAY